MLYLFALVSLALMTNPQVGSNSVDCARECLVNVEGVQPIYSEHSRSNISINNLSKQDLYLNVAAEGLEDNSWVELAGSISSPGNAFLKTQKFRKVKPMTSLKLDFVPCDIPILVSKGSQSGTSSLCSTTSRGENIPSMLRLRVDVFSQRSRQIVQRVRSDEFTIILMPRP
jgi:hypothetical protein